MRSFSVKFQQIRFSDHAFHHWPCNAQSSLFLSVVFLVKMNTLRISSSLYCRAHKLTLRHFRISSSPLAENPLGSELTDVEKREYEIAKKERDIRAAREKKLKEAKSALNSHRHVSLTAFSTSC